MVPEHDVIDLELSAKDAFKLVVSGGMVSSHYNRGSRLSEES
jgi:uncharacterized membrane protein